MYEKIKQYLTEEHFAWVIIDSISYTKIVSLMSRLNIDYQGVRITSLPHQKLAYDLAEESFIHIEIMNAVVKALDETNFTVIDKISKMSDIEVKTLISNPDNIFSLARPGNIIWALISDARLAINELSPKFLINVERMIKMEDRFFEQMDKKAEKMAPVFSKKGINKLLGTIALLEQQVSREQKISGNLIKEIGYLKDRNFKQQELINQLHKSCGEFTREKGVCNKQMEKRQKDIDTLNQQVRELKNQLAVGPKMRLKSEIHRLEKESANLMYTLEKERGENSAKINVLEKDQLYLKDEFKKIEQVNIELQQQLDNEKQRFAELQKSYELFIVKKEPVLPIEKGRRLGIFIDNQNVYYSSKRQFGRKINYPKLLELLVRDRHLVKAICYIVQQPEVNQEGFINMLKNNGYTVRMRDLIQRADGSAKGNWDIGIAADVITLVDKNSLDIVVLVTCDGDFVDLIKLLSSKGVRVEVVGFQMNTAMDLKRTADEYSFITEDLMIG